jgi:hypothetical protein
LGQVMGFDNVNHIGGLITGAALGFTLSLEHPTTARATFSWNGAAILGMVLVAVSFAMVAFHYGNMQRGGDVERLSARVGQMRLVLDKSFDWKTGSDQDPHKIASSIRSAADDIKRVPRIDARSDAVRLRILELAARRSSLLDTADKDFASLLKVKDVDSNDEDSIFDDYHEWEASVLADYGLEYVYKRKGG